MPSTPAGLRDILRQRRGEFLIGYVDLREEFRRRLAQESAERNILFLYGPAGMGKSTLARALARVAAEAGAWVTWCDELQPSPLHAMVKMANDLTAGGAALTHFREQYARWYYLQWQMDKDPYALLGWPALSARLTRYFPFRPAGSPSDIAHVLADFVAGQQERPLRYLGRLLESPEDRRLIQFPLQVLREAFIQDVNALAQEAPVLLILDSLDSRPAPFLEWLQALLDPGNGLSPRVWMVLCSAARPSGPLWEPLRAHLQGVSLEPFDPEMAGFCCSRYGVESSSAQEQVAALAEGRPAWITALAAAYPLHLDDVPWEEEPAGQLLCWMAGRNLERPLIAASILRSWDREALETVSGQRLTSAEWDWLLSLPFIQSHRQNWAIIPSIRSGLVDYVRRHRPEDWQALQQSACQYYRQPLEELANAGPARWKNVLWLQYAQEWAYHVLCQGDAAEAGKAAGILLEAWFALPSSIPAWLDVWSQAGRDAGQPAWAELAELGHQAWDAFPEKAWQALAPFLSRLGPLFPDHAGVQQRIRLGRLLAGEMPAASYDGEENSLSPDALPAELPQTHHALALHHLETGDLNAAQEASQRALAIDSGYVPAHILAGDVHVRAGQPDKALRSYQSAMEVLSDSIAGRLGVPHFRYADALTLIGNSEAAWDYYCRAFGEMAMDWQKAAAFLERGILRHQMGRWEEACRDYLQAAGLAGGGTNRAFDIYVNLTSAQRGRGDYRLALEYAERAFQWLLESPTPGEGPGREGLIAAHANRGNCRLLAGEPEGAIWDYDQAILRGAENPHLYTNRGFAFLVQGMPARAERDFARALELESTHPTAWLGLGLAHARQGRLTEARDDFKRAHQLAGDEPVYIHNLGLAYYHLGAYRRALAWLRQALALAPQDPLIYYHRGLCHAALEDHAQAGADFSEAIRLWEAGIGKPLPAGQPAAAYLARGQARLAAGDYTGAIEDFALVRQFLHRGRLEAQLPSRQSLLRLDDFGFAASAVPLDAQALKGWGDALAAQGKLPEAISYYDQALSISHDQFPEAFASRAEAYHAMGRHQEAIRDYQEALKRLPTRACWHTALGDVYARLGRDAEAFQAYERAIELTPSDPQAYLSLAHLSRRRKYWNRAIDAYRMAELFGCRQAELYWGRGEALLARGLHSQALADFERALSIDPADARASWGRARALWRAGQAGAALGEVLQTVRHLFRKRPQPRRRSPAFR